MPKSIENMETYSQTKLIIRPAKLEDAAGIAIVHVQTWQYAYKGLMPDSYLNSLSIEKRTEKWQANLSKTDDNVQAFVAELNDQIIGFCSVGKCRDEDMDSQTGELWAIYVSPNYMRQGVGTKLMNAGLIHLRKLGFQKATLWVLVENVKTRKWYEGKGWIIEGKTKSEPREGFELDEIRYLIDLKFIK